MSTGQVVHFVTAPDGVRLAYTDDGHGPAMVVVGHWPSHVVLDRSSPVWQHWIRGLGDGRRLIRYDNRATGLSSSGTEPMSLRTWTDDLESVVEAAGLLLLPGEAAWEAFRSAVDSFLRPRQAHAPIALKLLTKRERELLELIARGLENEDIAKALYISPRTVRNHITHVFGKLEVTTRAQAIILARDAGIGGR